MPATACKSSELRGSTSSSKRMIRRGSCSSKFYRSTEAAAQHKETEHYRVWRDAVADMMAIPRTSVKYSNLFPGDEGW